MYTTKQLKESSYDPQWLIELAQTLEEPHPSTRLRMVNAFKQCTHSWQKNDLYIYFLYPTGKNQPMQKLQCHTGFQIEKSIHGHLIIDVAADGRIVGIEFLDRVMAE